VCFAGDSLVRLHDGELRRMDKLEVGDWVLALSQGGQVVVSRVEAWIHRNPQRSTTFRQVRLDDGKQLKLTANHFIYKRSGGCGDGSKGPTPPAPRRHIRLADMVVGSLREAGDLWAGDCLFEVEPHGDGFVLVEHEVVEVVSVVEKGVYAPMTAEGNLFVNDLLVSCLSTFDRPLLQRNFLKVIMVWW